MSWISFDVSLSLASYSCCHQWKSLPTNWTILSSRKETQVRISTSFVKGFCWQLCLSVTGYQWPSALLASRRDGVLDSMMYFRHANRVASASCQEHIAVSSQLMHIASNYTLTSPKNFHPSWTGMPKKSCMPYQSCYAQLSASTRLRMEWVFRLRLRQKYLMIGLSRKTRVQVILTTQPLLGTLKNC